MKTMLLLTVALVVAWRSVAMSRNRAVEEQPEPQILQ